MGFLTNIGRMGELEAVQVFVPDIRGIYPFQPNCSLTVYESQPRLDIGLTKSELADWASSVAMIGEQGVGHGAADRAALKWKLYLPRPGQRGRSLDDHAL